jgi:Tfp pilus assembly ATPase PilU
MRHCKSQKIRRKNGYIRIAPFCYRQQRIGLAYQRGEPPIIRVHGEMTKVDLPPLDKEEVHNMVYDVLSDFQRKVFEEMLELDFSFALGDLARFRVNVFKQHRGESAVFRTIPSKIPSFDELYLPRVFKDLAVLEKGLVLVTVRLEAVNPQPLPLSSILSMITKKNISSLLKTLSSFFINQRNAL